MDYEQALRVNPSLLKAASGAGAEAHTDGGIKANAQTVTSPEKNVKNEQSVQNYLEAVRIVNSNLFTSFVPGTVFGGIVRPEYPVDHEKAYLCPEGLDAIMKDPKKILDSSRQELESKPGDAIALFRRGLAYQQMGKFQKALDDLDSAIQVQQNNTQFLLARAYLQHMNKNDAAAKVDIEKARLVDASLPAVIKF
jgi:tetratricopeptide (TPR) repeat protein